MHRWKKTQSFIRGNQYCSSSFTFCKYGRTGDKLHFCYPQTLQRVFHFATSDNIELFFGPLNAYVVLFTPVWKRDTQSSVGWERGRGGGGGGVSGWDMPRRENRLLLSKSPSLHDIWLHKQSRQRCMYFSQCCGINAAKEAAARAALCRINKYSSDGHRPFNVSSSIFSSY